MGAPARGDVTQLLLAWRGGDQGALNRLVPFVYEELHRLAQGRLRAQPLEHSLQTTALIQEVYLKLADEADLAFNDRVHFLAMRANMFRRILVDHARSRGTRKRGGDAYRVSFDEELHCNVSTSADVVQLDDALEALARVDPRKAKAIELRFFGGLSVEETAEALAVSRETVLRDWRMARAWLKSELSRASHG